ncbi:hypothetical protein AWB61_01235 [Chromobacterium sp. F49]|nr:hypothetical protein Cv017_18800 [Chromobacterium subtsugae]KZE86731.1 hypothetical protein AWB61_01235 [Chromobacterium sp. F49]
MIRANNWREDSEAELAIRFSWMSSNEAINFNHAYTLTALKYELKDKITAWNVLEQNIRSVLGE